MNNDGNDSTRKDAGAPDVDETRMTPPQSTNVSHSGWLSSSGSVDHGRFAPGTLLDNRYRVLGLLGRGGMGEVYRADDLRLGQQVALKFLPEALAIDARRLAQFHNEVRTARQVSHPNVCRVYDIGEINGQMFLTMEYVDGEDLSVLLRRIGRLPEERAIEIARQICAGLSAAHERGILHRDLKPANIMLDGAGKVRIMDFSLAAIGQVDDVRAGTPAYMAPEQLSGLEVTIRSDVYALGLVLYEVFTGRRAFDAKTIADLVSQHQSGRITSPAHLVSSLDESVDRAIMRCLDPDPARRPSSALAVAASLPGGDPLAAALAAGETPSPEMVAAAGGQGAAISAAAGVMWLLALASVLFLSLRISDRSSLISRVPLAKSADVLTDRAEQLRESFGYTDRVVDTRFGFTQDGAYVQWADDQRQGRDRWATLAVDRPAAVFFWYRTSPAVLVPKNPLQSATLADPPVAINGMTAVIVDTMGRLVRFQAAPPQQETPEPIVLALVNWDTLFAAAGFDRSAFTETLPQRTPPSWADERKAWQGTMPDAKIPIRIEASGYRGRPVSFDIVGPWTKAPRDSTDPPGNGSGSPILVAALLIGAVWAAHANLKSGRADKRGAIRLAAFMFAVIVCNWIVDPHVAHAPTEQQRLFASIGIAMFLGAVVYLIYLGLEPFIRRSSPNVLIGWSRVLAGQFRDPLVGRDLLAGVVFGVADGMLNLLPFIVPVWLGHLEPAPFYVKMSAIEGVRPMLGDLFQGFNGSLQNALISLFEWTTFRMIVEWVWSHTARRWKTATPVLSETTIVMMAIALSGLFVFLDTSPDERVMRTVLNVLSMSVALAVILRVGLFGAVVMYFVSNIVSNFPLTLDGAKLYAPASWTAAIGILALAAYGFWMARSNDQRLNRFERVR